MELPRRGLVPPDRFIRVAEATGLILGLGEFVLREACAQTAQWRREGLLPEQFVTWVNLSGRQLVGGGISRTVRGALGDAGLPPECLGLEVTETSLVEEGPGGNRARAARLLDSTERIVGYKVHKYAIDEDRFKA